MGELNKKENLPKNNSDDNSLDDMEKFAEECARRLAAEHERIAAENNQKEQEMQPNDEPESPEHSSSEASAEQDDVQPDVESEIPEPSLSDDLDDLEDDLSDDESEISEPSLSDDWEESEDELPDDESENPEPETSDSSLNEASTEQDDDKFSKIDIDVTPPQADGLTEIMKAQSYQYQRHEDHRILNFDDDETMPEWMNLLFSVILLLLGATGVWLLITSENLSYLLEAVCFIEVALCLLTAVGLNTSAISERGIKKNIMRTALWVIFIFYCLNSADELFLHRMIENGFAFGDFMQYAQNNISFDLFDGLSKLTASGIIETVLYMAPYAFCVPVLMRTYRNMVFYFVYMTCSFIAVSVLKIIAMNGGVSLAQLLIYLIGAAVVYIIIMLPPVQNGLRRIGLIEWAELKEDDE